MEPNSKRLVSVEDAAFILSVSERTVRSLISKGKLKPTRIGRRVLIPWEEIDRFINLERTRQG
jgi:excisionase family DNA binding protein